MVHPVFSDDCGVAITGFDFVVTKDATEHSDSKEVAKVIYALLNSRLPCGVYDEVKRLYEEDGF